MRLTAPAKINLYLEIIGNREDGFHELVMVMQSIELADEIEIVSGGDKNIQISCGNTQVPNDSSNLAYRAAALMGEKFPDAFAKYGGFHITITKNIPIAAGLAGGSTNAAAVFVAVNLLWELGLTQGELQEIAAAIGSDIPFCISGGSAIATGRGEQISPIPNLEDIYIVLGKYKSLEVSTPWAYKSYRSQFGHTYPPDIDSLAAQAIAVHSKSIIQAISHKDIHKISQELHNDLEKVVLPEYPLVRELKETFKNAGVLGTMMSGSGPSVFGICKTQQQAKEAQEYIREKIPNQDLELFVTKMVSHGIQVTLYA
jgi:4-diphosphocytidyl-2-C-methyl-D-erythritol kinase